MVRAAVGHLRLVDDEPGGLLSQPATVHGYPAGRGYRQRPVLVAKSAKETMNAPAELGCGSKTPDHPMSVTENIPRQHPL